MSPDQLPADENFLREKLANDPSDWETRRRLAHALYDRDAFGEAAEVIWMADQIPSNDIDLAYAARILSKSQPRKAIRLLAAVLELNRGKAVQNMGMANALLHHGMVLQAARFYGAALEADPNLVNPELEHFLLWTDDEMRLWADFSNRRPKLGELPWMARDPMEALRLTSRVSLHSTPIAVPSLPVAPGENLQQDMYQQMAAKNAKITPPPAVTIPIDRVDPRHRRFDDRYGATVVVAPAAALAPEPAIAIAVPVVAAPVPVAVPARPPTVAPPPPPTLVPPPPPAPLAPIQVSVPMAIPLPDHIVPVVAGISPTVPISPPPPSRSPSSAPSIPPPGPPPGPLANPPSSPPPNPPVPAGGIPFGGNTPPMPAPTKRLLTPTANPAVPGRPVAPAPLPPQ